MSGEDLNLHEVHFVNTAPKNIMVYEQYFRCKVRFDQPKTQLLLPVTEAFKPLRTGDHTLQQLLLQQAQALLDKLPNSTQLDQRLQHAILTGLQKSISNRFYCRKIRIIGKTITTPLTTAKHHLSRTCATSTFYARNGIFKRSAFELTRNCIATLLF
jgi:hypothetical protein